MLAGNPRLWESKHLHRWKLLGWHHCSNSCALAAFVPILCSTRAERVFETHKFVLLLFRFWCNRTTGCVWMNIPHKLLIRSVTCEAQYVSHDKRNRSHKQEWRWKSSVCPRGCQTFPDINIYSFVCSKFLFNLLLKQCHSHHSKNAVRKNLFSWSAKHSTTILWLGVLCCFFFCTLQQFYSKEALCAKLVRASVRIVMLCKLKKKGW